MLNLPLVAIAAENSFINDSAQNKNEHVVWNKLPITFVVPVNQERLISFPGQIQVVNANESLTKVKVNILNNAGTLYVKAHSTFDPVRLRVILKETGEVILLDLSAVNVGNDNPVDVVLASNITNDKNNKVDSKSTNNEAANVVSLTRYGIQQLYSPARLLEANSIFYRTPMYANKIVSFYYGDSINAFPLISWRGGDLYVTAVLLRNRISEQVVVDPNSFTGCWKSISFYPSGQLQVKGSQHDRATAFVVSTSPFGDALAGQCAVAR
jgi:integrating conjugative element protein (TIGR03749 family)